MIDTYLLEQLTAVYECGTLSAAAEKLHLTQPSLTRSMQKLETLFGVSLFTRQKNRLTLNPNGQLAAECAKHILSEEQEMISRVRALDRSSRMITVGTIAPGPMFELSPLLSSCYPEKTISTESRPEEELLQGLGNGNYQFIILNRVLENSAIHCIPCGSERLYFSVPPGHRIAEMKECTFQEMDGESFLMASDVGYWDHIVRGQMPNSRFLIQNDMETLSEIVLSSTIPSFATDITSRLLRRTDGRILIPIADEAAKEHFYCCCRKDDMAKYKIWFQMLEHQFGPRE